MSRKNEDLIVLILDRSGSMTQGYEKHIDGVNEFLRGQKAVQKPARITLVQFDDQYQVDYEEHDIQTAPYLTKETYAPRGLTALLDAIGKTINNVGRELEHRREKDRPDNVIFVIQTDGAENASKEFVLSDIAGTIRHQTDKYNWKFIFLGAGIDAIGTAAALGIPASTSIGYNKNARAGSMNTYGVVGQTVTSIRRAGVATAFTDKDREDAQKDDTK